MEVKMDAVSYVDTSQSLKKSEEKLNGVEIEVATRKSRSQAMDEFDTKIQSLTKIMKQYTRLLKNDVAVFDNAANVFVEADVKAASTYLKNQKTSSHEKGGINAGGSGTQGAGVR